MSERKVRSQQIKHHAKLNKLRNEDIVASAGSPRSPNSTSRNPGDLNRSPSALERQYTADGKKKFVPLETVRGLHRSNSIRISASVDRQRNLALANGESNANSSGSRSSSFNSGPASGKSKGPMQRASSASSYSLPKASSSGSSRGSSFGLTPIGKGSLYDPHSDETSSAGSTPSMASLNGFNPVAENKVGTSNKLLDKYRAKSSLRAGLKPMVQIVEEVENQLGQTTGTGSLPHRVAMLEKKLGLEEKGMRLSAGLVDRVRAIAFEVRVPINEDETSQF